MTDATPILDVTLSGRQASLANLKPWRSSEEAREAARRRVVVAEERARRGIVIGAGVKDWREGVTEIVAAQTGAAVSGKPGTSGAASFVLRAAGLLRERVDQAAPGPGSAADGDLLQMLTAFRRWRDAHPAEAAQLARLAAGAGDDVPGSAAPADE